MTKVFSPLNYHEREQNPQKFTQPSMAVPEQTLSVREIMIRYANGQEIGGAKIAIYEEEPSQGINPRTLDLVDIQEMKRENEALLDDLIKQSKKQKQESKIDPAKVEPEGH